MLSDFYKMRHLVVYSILSFDLLVLSKLAVCLQLICFVTFQSKHFSCCMRRRLGKICCFVYNLKKPIKWLHPNLWRKVLRSDHARIWNFLVRKTQWFFLIFNRYIFKDWNYQDLRSLHVPAESRLPKSQQENDLSSQWSNLSLVKQEEMKEDTRTDSGRNKSQIRRMNTLKSGIWTLRQNPQSLRKILDTGSQKAKRSGKRWLGRQAKIKSWGDLDDWENEFTELGRKNLWKAKCIQAQREKKNTWVEQID